MPELPDVPVVPGAASTCLRRLLAGPPRPAQVLGAAPGAVYLQVQAVAYETPPDAYASPATCPEPDVVAVLASDAVRLPVALVVAGRTADAPLAAAVGADHARVGDGTVRMGELRGGEALRVTVGRWWSPTPPRTPKERTRAPDAADREAVRALQTLLDADPHHLGEPLASRVSRLRAAVATADAPAVRRAAVRLLGLGPGLTPSGDDVLAGLLLGLAPSRVRSALADVAAAAGERTTALSATLLRQAAAGHAAPPVVAVADALAAGDAARVRQAVPALLAVGHSSGYDTACGLLAAVTSTRAGAGAAMPKECA